ncbi:MAG: DUF4956 domain-containing protein [Bdellovibrionales bacterium]|nr:DUF4956 domain-containing protein [Bdellovibrionales bacterium]
MAETNFLQEISKFTDIGQLITVSQVVICLLTSFLLSVAVAKTYQITYRGASFSPAFMHTLVICAMVIGSVMLIIGSNIARAFSLVGALSIIRFRNAVKDPRDVAYIFLVMGIGMASGTGFYQIAVALTVVTCAVSLLLYFLKFGEHGLSERILKIQAPATSNFENIFNDTLNLHAEQFNLISAESTRMGTELELTFTLKVPKRFSAEALMVDLSKLNENLKIQVVGSSHVLDL